MRLDYWKVLVWGGFVVVALVSTPGCFGSGKDHGDGDGCDVAVAGCTCYPNGTCELGYVCGADGLCAGSGSAGGAGGNPPLGSGGNSGSSDPPLGCELGSLNCNGCVNPNDNPLHCGGCDQPCPTGYVCEAGQCKDGGDCTVNPCSGFSYCDLLTKQCMPGCGANTQCASNEACDLAAHACICPQSFHDCNGACVPSDSTASCGSSCTACPSVANSTTTCDGASCGFECTPGSFECGGACYPGSGESVDACGPNCVPCNTVENGTAACVAGSCQYSCNANYVSHCGRCYPSDILTAPNAGSCTSNVDCCDELPQTVCNSGGFCVRPYQPCAVNNLCADGMTCVCTYGATSGDCQAVGDKGYCAPSCNGNAPCPRYLPNEYPNTVTACTLAAQPNFRCYLTCGIGNQCPDGWACSSGRCYIY